MAPHRDQFLKSHWEVEQLLRDLTIETLPINPFAIARRLDIDLKPLPASIGEATGILLHANGVWYRISHSHQQRGIQAILRGP